MATDNRVVMEPTLDEALSALFSSTGVQSTGSRVSIGKANLHQAGIELAEVQKALDSLKALLREPATPPK